MRQNIFGHYAQCEVQKYRNLESGVVLLCWILLHTRRDSESTFGAVYCPQIENVKKMEEHSPSGPLHINFRSGIIEICALWGINIIVLGGMTPKRGDEIVHGMGNL